MPDGRLSRHLGALLRAERLRAGLSQDAFARRAGATQQLVSRFESGMGAPSTETIERLFAVFGQQLRVALETLDADLEREIQAATRHGRADRLIATNSLTFLWCWGAWPPRMVIDGALAALLHGLPIAAPVYDLICVERDLETLAEWVVRLPNIQRFSERAAAFDSYRIDPREEGPPLWRTSMCQFRVRLVPELPEFVLVEVNDHELPVRLLTEVAADHQDVARVLGRLTTQQ